MNAQDHYAEDLARAQAMLAKTEATHGPDHVLVSHRLDEIARIMRAAKKDLPTAEKLEQRAKAIRVKAIQNDQKSETANAAMWEAVRESSARHHRQRARKQILMLCLLVVAGLAAAKVCFAPSPEEAKWRQSIQQTITTMNPTTLVNGMIDKSTAAAKEAAAAENARVDEVNSMIDNADKGTSAAE